MSQDALHNTLRELERALTRPRGNRSGEGDFMITGPCGEAVIPEGYEGAGRTVQMKAHKIERPGASPSLADIRSGDLANEWWAQGQTRRGSDGEAIQCVPESVPTTSSSYVEKPERAMSEREKLLRRLEENTSAINAMVMHSAATDCSSLSTPGTCGATSGRCMWGPTQQVALDGIDEAVSGPPSCHPTVAEQLQECATEAQRIRTMTLKTLDAQAALKSKYHDIIQADVTKDVNGRIVMDQKKARDMYSAGDLPAVTKKVGDYGADARRIQLQQAMTTAQDENATSELRDIARSVAKYNKSKADDDMCKLRFENGVTGSVGECFQDDNGNEEDSCVVVSTGQAASTLRGIRDDVKDSRVYESKSLDKEKNAIRPQNAECRAKSAEGIIWQAAPAVYDSGISQSVMNAAGVDSDLIRKAENDLTGDSAVDTDAGAMAFPILSAHTVNNTASDSIDTDLLERSNEQKFGMNERAPLAQMISGGSYPQRLAVENLWERMKNATATDITSIDSMDIMQEDLLGNPEDNDESKDYNLEKLLVTNAIAHVKAQAGGKQNTLENFSLYQPDIWPLYTDIFKEAHKGLDTGKVCVPVPFNHFNRHGKSDSGDDLLLTHNIKGGAGLSAATYGDDASVNQHVRSSMMELMAPHTCWNYDIGPPPSHIIPLAYFSVRAKVNSKREYPIVKDRVKIHPADLKRLRTDLYPKVVEDVKNMLRLSASTGTTFPETKVLKVIHCCDGSCFEIDKGANQHFENVPTKGASLTGGSSGTPRSSSGTAPSSTEESKGGDGGSGISINRFYDQCCLALKGNVELDIEFCDGEFKEESTILQNQLDTSKASQTSSVGTDSDVPLWIGTYTGHSAWLRENLNRVHPTVFHQLGAGPQISKLIDRAEGKATSDTFFTQLKRHMQLLGMDTNTLYRGKGSMKNSITVEIQTEERKTKDITLTDGDLGVIAEPKLGEAQYNEERQLIIAPRAVLKSIYVPPTMINVDNPETHDKNIQLGLLQADIETKLEELIVKERKKKSIAVLPIEMYAQMVKLDMLRNSPFEPAGQTPDSNAFPEGKNPADDASSDEYTLSRVLSGLATNTKFEAMCNIEFEESPTVQHTFMDQDVKDWAFLSPGAHHMVSTGLPVGPVGLFPGKWRSANDNFLLYIDVEEKEGDYQTTTRISSSKGFPLAEGGKETIKFTDCVNIHSGFVCRCKIEVNLQGEILKKLAEKTDSVVTRNSSTNISAALRKAGITPRGILQLQLRMLSDPSGPTGRVTRHITGKPLTAKNIGSAKDTVNIDRDLAMSKVNPSLLSGRYHSVQNSDKALVALDILYDAVGIAAASKFEGNTNRMYLHAGGSLRVKGGSKKLYGTSTKKWTELGTSGAKELLDWFTTPNNTTAGISVTHAEIDSSTNAWVPTYGPRTGKLSGGSEVTLTKPVQLDRFGVGVTHGPGYAGVAGASGQSIVDITTSVANQARFAYQDEMKAIDSVLIAHRAFPHVPPMTLRHAISPSSPFKSSKFRCTNGYRIVGNDPNHDFFEWIPHENRPWYVMLPTVVNVPSLTFVPDTTTQPFTKTGVPYGVGSLVRVVLQGEHRPRHARIVGYDPALSSYEMMVSDDGINPDTGRLMHLSTIGGHHRIISEVRGTPPATTASGTAGRGVQDTLARQTGATRPMADVTKYGHPQDAENVNRPGSLQP